MKARALTVFAFGLALAVTMPSTGNGQSLKWGNASPAPQKDTTYLAEYARNIDTLEGFRNVWSLDLLISNGGFGMGTIYRRNFTNDISGFVSFSISESKDDREFEYIDPYYYQTIVPGKLNRFLVLPLMFGVQYRLFREEIVDTFRPFVNAGVGPTMIYQMPFVQLVPIDGGGVQARSVEFFNSIGKGHPEYTASAFVGFGANFGGNKSSVFGVNFRYYFTYVFGDGLPSMFDVYTGATRAKKTDFGGFFITLNVGMAY